MAYKPYSIMANETRLLIGKGVAKVTTTMPAGVFLSDITKDTYVLMQSVWENANGSTYSTDELPTGWCKIKGRGNSTWEQDKKPYAFVFQTSTGANRNATPFGLPSEKDFNFMADAQDKTFLRNQFSMALSWCYGLPWASRMVKFEWYITDDNGTHYQGLYTLAEKVERSTSRINIGANDFVIEQQPTFQMDANDLTSEFTDSRGKHHSFKVPDAENVSDASTTAVQTLYNNLLDLILNGGDWRSIGDETSFVARYCIEDFLKDSDADGASWYHTIIIALSKIYAQPIWDKNNALGAWVANPFDPTDVDFTKPDDSFLGSWSEVYGALEQDEAFMADVAALHIAARPAVNQLIADLKEYWPALAATGAVGRDRALWTAILSDADYIPRANYAAEMDHMVNFITERQYHQVRRIYSPVTTKSSSVGSKPATIPA